MFILFASLWEVRARKGLIVAAAGGGTSKFQKFMKS